MRFLIVFVFSFCLCFANFIFDVGANVAVLKNINGLIYAGLDNGELISFDSSEARDNNKTVILKLPPAKDYLGSDTGATIFDVDYLDGKFVFLYNGDEFKKMLGVLENGEISHYELPITGIKNLYFYDENTVILLGLGTEILYFDLQTKEIKFQDKITIASLGGTFYERESGTLLISCEGGIVFVFDTNARKIVGQKDLHKDGMYAVAKRGTRMITGSNDKDKSCYYENGAMSKFFTAHFAVFAVALSDELGAFTVNNGINIIDANGEIVRQIDISKDVINYLAFDGEHLVGCGYNRYIYFWEIK